MKKLFLYSIVFTGGLQVHAFPPDVTLSNAVNMSYGTVEAGGVVGGTLSVGTDGSVAYTGDLSGDGVGVAAQSRGNPLNGATIADISCSTGATLCDLSSNSLTMTGIEVTDTAGRGVYGAANACSGVGNVVMSIPLNGTVAQRTVFLGGVVTVPAVTAMDGTYGTNITCGAPLVLEAIVP